MLSLSGRLTDVLLAAEEGAVEEDEDIFLVPNATFVVELLLFGLVLFIVWKFIVPPVAKAMAERQEFIARQNADSEAAAQALAAAATAYENAMSDARAEATRLREEARAHHKAVVDEAAAAAQAQADEIIASARQQLSEERDRAIGSLQEDVSALAKELASRVVGERV